MKNYENMAVNEINEEIPEEIQLDELLEGALDVLNNSKEYPKEYSEDFQGSSTMCKINSTCVKTTKSPEIPVNEPVNESEKNYYNQNI